jgi:hypothetical protein
MGRVQRWGVMEVEGEEEGGDPTEKKEPAAV